MNRLKAAETTINRNKVILALDVGEKRVGVAVAPKDVKIAHPYRTLLNDQTFDAELRTIVDELDVGRIIVGLPRGMEGQDTAQTESVRKFVKDHLSGCEVVFQDEALTSRLAEEELAKSGVRYNKEMVDALAASFILRDYLEQTINEEPEEVIADE